MPAKSRSNWRPDALQVTDDAMPAAAVFEQLIPRCLDVVDRCYQGGGRVHVRRVRQYARVMQVRRLLRLQNGVFWATPGEVELQTQARRGA